MRLLVCGSREWDDYNSIEIELNNFMHRNVSEGEEFIVVEGGARGADSLARQWAKTNDVPFEEYPADWDRYGKGAGPIRNQLMLDTGVDHVIAFTPDLRTSKGTRDMVRRAREANVTVTVITY